MVSHWTAGTRRGLPVVVSLASVACATPHLAAAPARRATADVVAGALPAVALLLSNRPDGKVGFGAGLVLDDHGLVVTNLHVVANARSIGVVFYDPARTTYSVMDGGLARFLFENHKAIVPARLVRADPVLDLALVRADRETAALPHLPFRPDPIRPGETVLALGHPGETAWSFTSGVVSSIQQGVIQHDAPIDHGSSGGPLLDDRGRVIGINTARVMAPVSGVGFARPIELVRPLVDEGDAPNHLDLSSPARAVVTCLRAVEMAMPDFPRCVDWDGWFDEMARDVRSAYGQKRAALPPAEAAKADEVLDRLLSTAGREAFVATVKKAAVFELRGGDPNALADEFRGRLAAGMPDLAIGKVSAVLANNGGGVAFSSEPVTMANVDPDLLARNGLRIDPHDAAGRLQVLKMGIRVDLVKPLDADHAWVSISGRNLDGSEHHHSELWVRFGTEWKWQDSGSAKTPPPGWPPPLKNFNWYLGRREIKFDLDKGPQKP